MQAIETGGISRAAIYLPQRLLNDFRHPRRPPKLCHPGVTHRDFALPSCNQFRVGRAVGRELAKVCQQAPELLQSSFLMKACIYQLTQPVENDWYSLRIDRQYVVEVGDREPAVLGIEL